MTQKYLWSVVLIALLIAGVAVPARADNGMTVVIVIAATTAAVAIVAFVTVAGVHHRHKKIVITGCVVSGQNGLTLTDEEDRKTYTLSGNTTDIKAGDRMRLQGKKAKPGDSGKALVWETKQVINDYGVCQP